uniref:Putative dUTP diphosphatase n=1 Tax=viral metagenome TaxID=1070528 RepID=A0A6H2A3R9_9ZZZZ
MNIRDIEQVKIDGDMLKAIFSRQKELEEKYHDIEASNGALVLSIPLDLNTFSGQERTRLLIYRIAEELFESGNCLRNKAWKQSQVPVDIDHFLEELADGLHFYIQLFIELGLTSEDVCSLYFKKSEVNKFRQRSNY